MSTDLWRATRTILPAAALLAAGAGCTTPGESEPEPRPGSREELTPVVTDGQCLFLRVSEDWVPLEPERESRLAEFRLPGEEAEEAATLTVYWFDGRGGTVEDNLRRWGGQFASDETDPLLRADIRMLGASGARLTRMRLAGTYVAAVAPGSPEHHDEPGWALDAAIWETPYGPVFLKAVGPRATLRRHSAALGRLYANLRFEPAPAEEGDPGDAGEPLESSVP